MLFRSKPYRLSDLQGKSGTHSIMRAFELLLLAAFGPVLVLNGGLLASKGWLRPSSWVGLQGCLLRSRELLERRVGLCAHPHEPHLPERTRTSMA